MNTASHTKTLENTKENVLMLTQKGYKKSNVSKPNGVNKVLRYNPIRMEFWYSNRTAAYKSDCYFVRKSVGTIWCI